MSIRQESSHRRRLTNIQNNPRVILKPLMADQREIGPQAFKTSPFTSSLFNQPELSDIRLEIGDQVFYAHKLILSAASSVFNSMFNSGWKEGGKDVLKLEETDECTKHFDKFLNFIYTSSIVLVESYVWPIFLLADKYEVTSLYEECASIIRKSLKVYVIRQFPEEIPSASNNGDDRSSYSDSSSLFSPSKRVLKQSTHSALTPL